MGDQVKSKTMELTGDIPTQLCEQATKELSVILPKNWQDEQS